MSADQSNAQFGLPGHAAMSVDERTVENLAMQFGSMSISRPNVTCIDCRHNILEKWSCFAPRFGMLDGCNCVFCFVCLQTQIRLNIQMNLKKGVNQPEENMLRSFVCPTCKKSSNIILSSSTFYTTMEEKFDYVTKFRESLQIYSCPFMQRGIPICYCSPNHYGTNA